MENTVDALKVKIILFAIILTPRKKKLKGYCEIKKSCYEANIQNVINCANVFQFTNLSGQRAISFSIQ